MFYEKEPPKTNQTDFKIKKLFKKKDDKFYIKWKGYDNSFNRCIDKKDIVIFTFQSHVVIAKMKQKLKQICLTVQKKSDLKIAAVMDKSKFANLANLKADIDKLEI